MNLKGIIALGVCLVLTGFAQADDGMGYSQPKSVTATCLSFSAEVTWEAVTAANLSGYNVYQQVQGGQDYAKSNSEMITTAHFNVQNLEIGMTYHFAVTAVYNDEGESSMSDSAACTTA